jgi:hypothetical protein
MATSEPFFPMKTDERSESPVYREDSVETLIGKLQDVCNTSSIRAAISFCLWLRIP